MKLRELVLHELITNLNVPGAFTPNYRKNTATEDYMEDAGECPSCSEHDSLDRASGLCSRCHGALRIVMAMRRS